MLLGGGSQMQDNESGLRCKGCMMMPWKLQTSSCTLGFESWLLYAQMLEGSKINMLLVMALKNIRWYYLSFMYYLTPFNCLDGLHPILVVAMELTVHLFKPIKPTETQFDEELLASVNMGERSSKQMNEAFQGEGGRSTATLPEPVSTFQCGIGPRMFKEVSRAEHFENYLSLKKQHRK